MKRFAITITLALALANAHAGEVNLTWDASAGASGYRVYSGTASGEYGPNPLELVATATPYSALLDGCVQQFLAVTAFNLAGESSYSDELAVYPRPVFLGPPTFDEGDTGNPADDVIAIVGGNFAPGITLTINNTAVPFTVDDCASISIPVLTLPAPLQGQPMTFQLCNGPVCEQESIPVVSKPGSFTAT